MPSCKGRASNKMHHGENYKKNLQFVPPVSNANYIRNN